MKTLQILLLSIALTPALAQYNADNLSLASAPHRFKNLELYPIRGNDVFLSHNKASASYKPLSESIQQNKIRIREKGSGEVNKLVLENTSKDTIIILSGEVIQGGKQDRMLAQDVLLAPNAKKEVEVFCVEQGRWQSSRGDMNFNSYFTISSKEVRKAGTVKKNQSEVWKEVAATNQKNKAETTTGTLTALEDAEEFKKELNGYTSFFKNRIVDDTNVIGIIAVTGNVVIGCDMFASHQLFVKYYDDLVNSYAAEAFTNGDEVDITKEKVQLYLLDFITDEAAQEQNVNEKGTILKDGNRKIHISTFD